MRKVNSDRVKVNYDTANVVFYGRVDPVEDLKACVSDVAFLHIKDKAGAADEWNFPAPGKGYIDFDGIFDVLNQNGNNSPFSVEIEFTAAGPSTLEEVNQAVRDSAAFFRAHGIAL